MESKVQKEGTSSRRWLTGGECAGMASQGHREDTGSGIACCLLAACGQVTTLFPPWASFSVKGQTPRPAAICSCSFAAAKITWLVPAPFGSCCCILKKVTIASFHSFRPRLLADSTHASRGVLFGAHIVAQSAGITLPSSPTLVCVGWIPGLFSRGELGPINQANWQVVALHLANSKRSTHVCFIVLTNSPGSRQLDMVCETLKPPQRGPTPFPRIPPPPLYGSNSGLFGECSTGSQKNVYLAVEWGSGFII